ncbi:hypothetical protein [Arthrobacter sp. ES3-54]|nr:hypothetical protein [Arthrobacter sp. ES3-54]MDF9749585.1 hypothetical protein [Arthrobacter sp. ES3-54]
MPSLDERLAIGVEPIRRELTERPVTYLHKKKQVLKTCLTRRQ